MLDIDQFKAVNDRFGHPVGDKVLAASADYFMNHVRSYDKVFRYGGEEFMICMPGLSVPTAFSVVERLRQGIAECSVPHENQVVRITVSFGIVGLDSAIAVEESVERADVALYSAKAAGRNCSRTWDDALAPPRPT